jgi:hypothetical protein
VPKLKINVKFLFHGAPSSESDRTKQKLFEEIDDFSFAREKRNHRTENSFLFFFKFRKTLKSIGSTHAASFKEEETFLTAQIRYEHLLTRILTVNLNKFHEAKQDYEVSKINFDIATHNHTNLNSVPGQKLTAAQLKLDQETDNYQNSKKAILDLNAEYLEVEADLSLKTLEMERTRKNFLVAQVTNLEGLLDENQVDAGVN